SSRSSWTIPLPPTHPLSPYTTLFRSPQHALLHGERAAERHQELHHPAHLVRAMGEVAVISPRDEEHADEVQRAADHPVDGARARPEQAERDEVNQHEGDRLAPSDPRLRAAQSTMHV